MTVVISPDFVLTENTDNLDANSPIIGYDNVVPGALVSATTEDPDWPVSNLQNPSTYLKWRSGAGSPSSDEYIMVIPDSTQEFDYLAIARHNFGSNQSAVSVEGVSTEPGSPADWFELTSDVLLANDNPVIFRFTKQPLYAIRLRIQPAQAAAPATSFLAVMYVGELLLLQRRIYVGHTPITLGREVKVANQRSIAGDFLGRIVLSESTSTSVALQNLTPDWYRLRFDPFVIAAKEAPFFFNWRPGDYPLESGYAWLTADPRPTNQRSNGMMQVNFDMEGIVS